jgi:hypothetical protein
LLTRGHLIGQIVDDLTSIAAQAKQRARLHLFDVHTHVENFAKEILNRGLGLSLINLNEEHSNHPGLDLGDAGAGWAFQVTADKSSTKVRETLEKIDADLKKKYPHIRILVIGEKQGSYSFSGEPFESFGFTSEMVWDFNDICARIMSLSIETLVELASYVSRETRRVRIELEIPDEEGRFASGIEQLIESLPKPRLSDAAKFVAHFEAKGAPVDQEQAEAAIRELSAKLGALPRLTREVFTFLVSRRDDKTFGMYDDFRISDPKLRRIYRGEDLDGDLALLVEAGLLDGNDAEERGEAYFWRIIFPGRREAFHLTLVEYAAEVGFDLRKALVTLDFSDF